MPCEEKIHFPSALSIKVRQYVGDGWRRHGGQRFGETALGDAGGRAEGGRLDWLTRRVNTAPLIGAQRARDLHTCTQRVCAAGVEGPSQGDGG